MYIYQQIEFILIITVFLPTNNNDFLFHSKSKSLKIICLITMPEDLYAVVHFVEDSNYDNFDDLAKYWFMTLE